MTGLGLGSPTPEQVTAALRATQNDLDTLAACASAAINSPVHALLPAGYAAASAPPKQYPSSQPPPVGPRPLAGTSRSVPPPVLIRFLMCVGFPVNEAHTILQRLGLQFDDEPAEFIRHRGPRFCGFAYRC